MTVAPRRVARTIASARVSTFPPPVPVVPSGLVVLTVRLDWRIERTRASGATPTKPGGRVGRRGDDAGDEGAVTVAVEQAAVAADEVATVDEAARQPRVRADARVDHRDGLARAAGEAPRVGEPQTLLAPGRPGDDAAAGRAHARDAGPHAGQRVGLGIEGGERPRVGRRRDRRVDREHGRRAGRDDGRAERDEGHRDEGHRDERRRPAHRSTGDLPHAADGRAPGRIAGAVRRNPYPPWPPPASRWTRSPVRPTAPNLSYLCVAIRLAGEGGER